MPELVQDSTEIQRFDRRYIQRVDCPYCRATPGEYCTRKGVFPVETSHLARWHRWAIDQVGGVDGVSVAPVHA